MKRLSLILMFMGVMLSTGSMARESYSLDKGWGFFFSHEASGDSARHIDLPHTWNQDALVGVFPYLRTQGLYTRSLYIPKEWSTKRLFLRFYGAESTLDLQVNGSYAGTHLGSGVAFTFEITEFVNFGEDNLLTAIVSNTQRNDILPASSERNIYGGLTRGVELLVTDDVALSPLHYGTDGVIVRTTSLSKELAEGVVDVHITLRRHQTVELTLEAQSDEGERLFVQRRTIKSSYDFRKPVRVPFAIENPQLWSPESPNLCHFKVTLRGEEEWDEVSVTTGLRSVELTDKGLMINGKRVTVRGLSLGYEHPIEGAYYMSRSIDEDLKLVKELGATALRSPMGPHIDYLYEQCDKEGLLAWIDLPFARTRYLSDIFYYASSAFEQNAENMLREIVLQNANHPSVICWGIFTNLRAIDKSLCNYIRRLNSVAKECDPTRPTVATSNQDGEINFITDGIVWNQNLGWERGLVDDIPIWLEQLANSWSHLRSAVNYGFEGFANYHPDEYQLKATPSSLDLTERRQSRFHEKYSSYLEQDTLMWGVWIDCLSDYKVARRVCDEDARGLVTYDRKTKKDAFYLYKTIWNSESRVLYIADRRWRERKQTPQRFYIYATKGIEPVMLLNGDTLTLERLSSNVLYSEEITPASDNLLYVEGGGLRDSLRFRCDSPLKRPVQQAPLQIVGLQ